VSSCSFLVRFFRGTSIFAPTVDLLNACCAMDPPALPVSFVSGSDEEDSTGDVSGGTAPAASATAVTAPTHAGTTAAPTTAVPAPATRAGEAPGLPGHDEWAGTPAESTRPRHHPTARHRERGEEEMKGLLSERRPK